jgi:hypothetical protein
MGSPKDQQILSGFARRNTALGVSKLEWLQRLGSFLSRRGFVFTSLVVPPARAQQEFVWTFLH